MSTMDKSTMETTTPKQQPQQAVAASGNVTVETEMNKMLLDPPQWGWSALGGVVNLLPPHERARRSRTRETLVKKKRRNDRIAAARRKKEQAMASAATTAAAPAKQGGSSLSLSAGEATLTAAATVTGGTTATAIVQPPTAATGPVEDGKQPASMATTAAATTTIGTMPIAAVTLPVENGKSLQQQQQQQHYFWNGMATGANAQDIAAELAAAIVKNQPDAAAATPLEGRMTQTVVQAAVPQGDCRTTTAEDADASSSHDTAPRTSLSETAATKTAATPLLKDPADAAAAATSNQSAQSTKATRSNAGMEQPRPSAPPASTAGTTATPPLDDANDKECAAAAAPVDGDGTEREPNNNDSNKDDDDDEQDDKESTNNQNEISIRALNEESGVLDMYTYHRGREGLEPRDEATGELLCDVEPTDTNYGWEPPNLKISINVAFPISDQLLFTETIDWDLADDRTMTPLSFATRVSEEYGLDVSQTLELAESIQRQINNFVQQKVSYKSPLTLLDAHGNERNFASAQNPSMRCPPQLFGSVIGDTKPGMPLRQKGTRLVSGKSVGASRGASEERASLGKRPRSASKRPSFTSVEQDVEPEYKDEVLRRAQKASMGHLVKQPNNGRLMEMHDSVCHACTSRRSICWKFPCENPYHMLCKGHITAIAGLNFDDDTEIEAPEVCPMCSLRCDCRKCTRKLLRISADLKARCLDQGVPPGDAAFDELFEKCLAFNKRAPDRRGGAGKKLGSAQKRAPATSKATVPKIPAADFPREVCGGRDMDPGTSDDYRKVYTAEGAFLRNDASVSADDAVLPALTTNGVQEDGNVDYCIACKKHGNLLCCDFCPRAFHPECVTSGAPSGEGGDWECFVCRQEKEAGDGDVVTGESSLALVHASLADSIKESEGGEKSVQILALIHDMVLKLMDYDFGYLFRQPVDCSAVPGYSTIVKSPMDLGTVASRISDGAYASKYRKSESWDDVIVAALRDIELVWHNCFTFNCEGSSIYRMAEVQSRKYLRIRKRSIDCLLSLDVKRRVDDYVAECRLERSKIVRPDRRANGRNKITLDGTIVKKSNKIVVVLDPDTGMLVKMYSTFKAASLAALFLVGLGHPMEVPSLGDASFKAIVRRSCKNPKLLLFGYRWLYMHDLADGKVKFNATKILPPCTVEARIGTESYAFVSIEEALSWPDLPDGPSKVNLRQALSEMHLGEWTCVGGLSWRKMATNKKQKCVESQQEDAESQLSSEENANVENNCHVDDVSKYPFPANVGFVKEDLITRRALVGFTSASAAHADWLKTREGSPLFPINEQADFAYFTSYYLDGERNVDGIIWRTVQASPPIPVADVDSTSGTRQDETPLSEIESKEDKPSTPQSDEALGRETSSGTQRGLTTGLGESSFLFRGPAKPPATSASVLKPCGTINGHHPTRTTSDGDLLLAKRKRENESLTSHVANKKAAVCYN